MRQTKLLLTFVVVCFGLVTLSAYADNSDPLLADKRDAQAWLKKVQAAAQKLNYSGTFVYQQANQVRMSRVTHVYDGKNEFEKLEILDGRPREYIRKNDDVACYIPETRTILVEKSFTQEFFPAMLAANSTELTDHYEVHKLESGGRVAGFDCDIIALEAKDGLRYGYRLWVEKNSGLLLRAQTVNEHHDVVEQITFAQIAIGGIDRNSVHTSFPNVGLWHVEFSPMIESPSLGWSVSGVPAGFKKTHEFKSMVTDRGVFPPGTPVRQHSVEQMIFSDGLAAISVFVEPGSQSGTEGSLQQGATNIVGKRQGDYWLTIVGEVPAAALRNVANSIEFNKTK